MKIKRIFAENARLATRELKRTLGPDAVILSNKCVDGGVELVGAVDYDEEEFRGLDQEEISRVVAKPASTVGEAAAQQAPPSSVPEYSRSTTLQSSPEPVVPESRSLLSQVHGELREMRELLATGVSGLAWSNYRRTTPQSATLLGKLMDFGLRPELCNRLLDELGGQRLAGISEQQATAWLKGKLQQSSDDVLNDGGVLALVGPTGVGKTTTVAKIAARYTLVHGPHKVALITTDSYRIGALEQLRTFGRILGMPVRVARDENEMKVALDQFSDRRLVLIDTAGMSPRDLHVAEQIGLLRSAKARVRTYLVLAANAQFAALEETVAAFASVRPSACVITKLDEANRVGGVLSAVIDAGLELAFTSDGQHVPQDLHRADLEKLVTDGWQQVAHDSPGIDQEVLALTFGNKVVHAYA